MDSKLPYCASGCVSSEAVGLYLSGQLDVGIGTQVSGQQFCVIRITQLMADHGIHRRSNLTTERSTELGSSRIEVSEALRREGTADAKCPAHVDQVEHIRRRGDAEFIEEQPPN